MKLSEEIFENTISYIKNLKYEGKSLFKDFQFIELCNRDGVKEVMFRAYGDGEIIEIINRKHEP